MEISDPTEYELLDSGQARKLERFGRFVLSRPCVAAVWNPLLSTSAWQNADAVFDREGGNAWSFRQPLPETWPIVVDGLQFSLSATGFGHVGVFPEHRQMWKKMESVLRVEKKGAAPLQVLNLFAYTGGATLAAARAGAAVCHVDASRGMVARARENAALNGLESTPIRWIVDDVHKFLQREERRGTRYDGIILDPPSFGRGKSGEVFKIETDLIYLLEQCARVLSEQPRFMILSCHTPAFTPLVLRHVVGRMMQTRGGRTESGELILTGDPSVLPVPSGTFAMWAAEARTA